MGRYIRYSIAGLLLAGSLFLLQACKENPDRQNGNTNTAVKGNTFLPTSTGTFDEVLIVTGKELQSRIKSAVSRSFGRPYGVMPQPEPSLKLNFVTIDKFESLFKRFRNVVIIADLSKDNDMSRYMAAKLGDDRIAQSLNDPDYFYEIATNQTAKPQTMVFMFANGEEQLINHIENDCDPIVNRILNTELQRYWELNFANGQDLELKKIVKERHQVNMSIPKEYQLALKGDGFTWLRYETIEASSSILVSTKPLEPGNRLQQHFKFRNQVTRNINSENENSYMTIDTAYVDTKTRRMKIDGKTVYEMRGLWEMENDFMGGPFVSYLFIDEARQRMVLVDCFVYGPGTTKKQYIRQLESIVSGVQLPPLQ